MGETASQVDLLVTLLVRFPEMSAVHYEPDEQVLRMVFLLKGRLEDQEALSATYRSHLAVFHRLQKKAPRINTITLSGNSQLTILEIKRDMATLSLAELNPTMELLNQSCGEIIVREGPPEVEDDWENNALIELLLSEAKTVGRERLSGFRQDGRVLVFSIPLAGVSEQ